MDRGCAPCRILFLKRKSIWVLFLMTFLLAGLGTLFINFFFDSLNAWKNKKEGNEVKEGIYAKVEAHISGDYFPIACRYWNCEIRNANRKWAWFTACIGIFSFYNR